MHPRLKKIIFNKLYEDLKHTEIIPYKDSIWFIDREKKYWYLQYKKTGYLWWRYKFFTIFFLLFSLEQSEYERVIADWVEEVLNSRVKTTKRDQWLMRKPVEEVLNSRVNTTVCNRYRQMEGVEEVLNSRVNTTFAGGATVGLTVEEVLNVKVDSTRSVAGKQLATVEEVLNFKVDSTSGKLLMPVYALEVVLNSTL